jgi:hypothetical protein
MFFVRFTCPPARLHVNQERKQKLVPKGPVLHTGDSVSFLCNATGENDGDLIEIAEMDIYRAAWSSLLCHGLVRLVV